MTRAGRFALIVLLGASVLRWLAAQGTGFADAEALYAVYALHPQPAYLDHPGLVGEVMRWLGRGGAPSPEVAHAAANALALVTAALAGAAAHAAGAARERAWLTAGLVALVPQVLLGLWALGPDALLAPLWLGALASALAAARRDPRSLGALSFTVASGALVGLATLAKLPGALLGLGLLTASLTAPLRARWRTPAPWAALGVALVLVAPLVTWEQRLGWPMLRHRLIATQASAGFSLRNLGALIGGQLLYVGPPALYVAFHALARARRAAPDAARALLFGAVIVPAVPLALLCLWSRVSEPHWVAPAFLALGPLAAVYGASPRALRVTAGLGVTLALATLAWVKTDLPQRWLGKAYRPRYDLANDLHAWKPGAQLVQSATRHAGTEWGGAPVLVGPHWTVCARLALAVAEAPELAGVQVGCAGPVPDDFGSWLPPSRWERAPVLVYVTDDRWSDLPERVFKDRTATSLEHVDVLRGGVTVRRISALRLVLQASATLDR